MRYNSWDRNFKAPFGALKTSQNATIKVKVNKNFNVYSIKLIIEKEDENLKPVIVRELDLKQVSEYNDIREYC